ncbi:MAG: hypothetical protein HC813_02780, partial [Planctomycetes bacterium]|nr:hypothetical protein [Planctomycetota bacterium]
GPRTLRRRLLAPYAGVAASLPARLRLDAELATIHPEPGALLWRFTLAHSDLFERLGSYASLTVYSLEVSIPRGSGGSSRSPCPSPGEAGRSSPGWDSALWTRRRPTSR